MEEDERMQSITWYRIPSRKELRRRKWEKKKEKIKKKLMAAMTAGGFLLGMAIEQNLWMFIPATGLLVAALVIGNGRTDEVHT